MDADFETCRPEPAPLKTTKIPNINAVAFDLDGLMVNTEDLYDEVLDRILQRRGLSFSLELKLAMMGLKAEDAFEVLKNRCQLTESLAQIRSEVEDAYLDLLQTSLEPMPGLLELFQLIDKHRIPRAVTTSSPRPLAHATLTTAGIEAGFQFVLTGDDVEQGKPEPEIYLRAADKFVIPPNQMLALEDSYTGSLAASRSGAFTVVVPGRHSEGQNFSHANLVVERLDSQRLIELIGTGLV